MHSFENMCDLLNGWDWPPRSVFLNWTDMTWHILAFSSWLKWNSPQMDRISPNNNRTDTFKVNVDTLWHMWHTSCLLIYNLLPSKRCFAYHFVLAGFLLQSNQIIYCVTSPGVGETLQLHLGKLQGWLFFGSPKVGGWGKGTQAMDRWCKTRSGNRMWTSHMILDRINQPHHPCSLTMSHKETWCRQSAVSSLVSFSHW